jgi:hypothetical protein
MAVYLPNALYTNQGLLKGANMELEEFKDFETKFPSELLAAIAEAQQSRSNFQIQKFVVGQHETQEMRYIQTLNELQNLYYTLKRVSLEIKKTEIEIERKRATGDPIDEIDAQLKELSLEQTRLVGIGSFRELEELLLIFNSFERKFTREEIEAAQPDYWNKRLQRQAILESIGGSQAQASHLDALRQIGAISVSPEQGIVPSSNLSNEILGSTDKELE